MRIPTLTAHEWHRWLVVIATTLHLQVGWAAEPIYVVVPANSPIKSITQKELLAVYTGRTRQFSNGAIATPLDQRKDGPIREAFYLALTGMDIARINSYWARLHFTGQVTPPVAMPNETLLIERLRADASTIAYMVQPPTDPALRVVLRLP